MSSAPPWAPKRKREELLDRLPRSQRHQSHPGAEPVLLATHPHIMGGRLRHNASQSAGDRRAHRCARSSKEKNAPLRQRELRKSRKRRRNPPSLIRLGKVFSYAFGIVAFSSAGRGGGGAHRATHPAPLHLAHRQVCATTRPAPLAGPGRMVSHLGGGRSAGPAGWGQPLTQPSGCAPGSPMSTRTGRPSATFAASSTTTSPVPGRTRQWRSFACG